MIKAKRYGKFRILSQYFSLRDFLREDKIKLIKREWRFFKQRLHRGWDDSETWMLDKEVAEFIYPRLKRYFEITITGPPYVQERDRIRQLTNEEWDRIKNKILYALKESRLHEDGVNKDWDKIEEGWELFFKHRKSFWW